MREELTVTMTAVIVFLAMVVTPILYLKGSAKSKWLNITRNINISWYEAAFLDIRYSDIEGNFKIENK